MAIIRDVKNSRGQLCRVVILIDPLKTRVCGHYLYDSTGNLLASSEVMKYDPSGFYPRRWGIRWSEGGVSMELELLSPSVNKPVDPMQWQMPDAKRSVNMAKD
jgi:hypothetical protein